MYLQLVTKYLSRLDNLITVSAPREELTNNGQLLRDSYRKFRAQQERLIETGESDENLLIEYEARVNRRLNDLANHLSQRNWINKDALSLPELPANEILLPDSFSLPPRPERFMEVPSILDQHEYLASPLIPPNLQTPFPQTQSFQQFKSEASYESKPKVNRDFRTPLISNRSSSSSSGRSSNKSEKLREVEMKKASEIARLKQEFLEEKLKIDLQLVEARAEAEVSQIESQESIGSPRSPTSIKRQSTVYRSRHSLPSEPISFSSHRTSLSPKPTSTNHNQNHMLPPESTTLHQFPPESNLHKSAHSQSKVLLPPESTLHKSAHPQSQVLPPESTLRQTAQPQQEVFPPESTRRQKVQPSQSIDQSKGFPPEPTRNLRQTTQAPQSVNQGNSQTKFIPRQVEPCDQFIDDLTEYKETEIPIDISSSARILQIECESRHLPPIELKRFGGNSLLWPEFIQNFKSRIHFKSSFNDTIRMERLISVLDGEARKSIESIGTSAIFYATALKALKRDYGNPYVIAHLKLKEMFDKPQISISNHEGLRNFYQQLRTAISWFESIGNSNYNNPETVAKAVSIIPVQHKFRFFKRFGSDQSKLTDLYVFVNWLEGIVKELFNPIAMILSEDKPSKSPKEKPNTNVQRIRTNQTNRQLKCWLCSNDHKISKCPQLVDVTPDERQKLVKEKGLCFNCLSNNHMIKECPSKNTCSQEGCGKKHHTLLHRDFVKAMQCSVTNHTFLQIVPVILTNGKYSVKTNAVLDSGSDSTLIRADTAEALHLSGRKQTLTMSNVLSKETNIQSQKVSFSLRSHDNKANERVENVWVIDKLDVPVNKFDIKKVKNEFPHLKDVDFPTPHDSDVTILIGADLPYLLVHEKAVTGTRNQPMAIKTKLGWMLFGGKSFTSLIVTNNFLRRSRDEISDKLERFWQMESYGTLPDWHKSNLPPIEQRSLHKLETTSTIVENRMEVGLLWKEDQPKMPYNRDYAIQRLNSLEKKLSKDPNLAKMYDTAIREFIDLGHARILTESERNTRSDVTNYIPHHGVTHPNKPGKVRVVFDAASKFKGTSLNDKLLAGPDLLNSLVAVLHRFRSGRYAASADIEKMFNQVKVSEKDIDALRFVYRFEPGGEVKDCVLLFHVYGKKDSPCIANFALRSSADETSNQSIRDEILRNFYVDDYLGSFYTGEELLSTATDLNTTVSTRGFNLTKWSSNDKELIKHLPADKISPKIIDINKEVPRQKTLGLLWDPNQDVFIFTVNLFECEPTKRRLLSQIGSIFDPLGFLTPVVLEPKLIVQQLWKRKIDWDEPLPSDLHKRWIDWKVKIKQLDGVTVPRWCGYQPDIHSAPELHIFVDGSDDAYGAVAYLRFITPDTVHCSLVMSKSRLAPLKRTKTESTTTPALELQGAVIGSRMKTTLLKESKFEIASTTFWADSEVTLKCILNESTTFSKYVMNRLDEVRTNSDYKDWQFISGNQNPGDDCTRYVSPFKLTSAGHRWFNGPSILHEKGDIRANDVLALLSSTVSATTIPSETTCEVTTNNTSTSETIEIIKWDHYSSWTKLKRHVAWLLKIQHNFRSSKTQPTNWNFLTSNEIEEAEKIIIQIAQRESFGNQALKNQKLRQLNPFYDNDGLLRVGGRIKHANVGFERKHQLIISNKHPIARILTLHVHETNYHCGREATLAILRHRFWLISGKNFVRKIIQHCSACTIIRASTKFPTMSDIPKERLAVNEHAFTYCGVDYFGPLIIKLNRNVTRRNAATAKRWVSLMTCLTTRAVHLELVHDLTTDCFLLAFRRFTARRGKPKEMHSDNGTNFVGAINVLNDNKLLNSMSNWSIEWKLNPPAAPWMGGIYESMVKIAKKCLRTIVTDKLFDEESLRTFLTEIESFMNSRPLTSISDDPLDTEVLTPNHFLTGRISTPEETVPEFEINAKNRWRKVQAATSKFWQLWLNHYLPTLTKRLKWFDETRSLRVNDIVVYVDDTVERQKWPIGRIIEVFPGGDGIVRKVTLKTKTGIYTRPAAKCYLLEGAE